MHPLQALFHAHLGIVAQQLPGLIDTGEAVRYIPIPIRAVLGTNGTFRDIPDVLPQRIQVGAFPASHVVDLIQGFLLLSEQGAQVSLNRIIHVGEIPAVGAVTVDGGGVLVQGGLEEQGDHGRVGSVRVLSGSEDIEIAQSDIVDTVCFRKNIGVEFVHVLGHSVGRQRLTDSVLDLGQGFVVAVGAAGGSKDHSGYPLLHGCLKDLQGAGDVNGIGGQGILQTAGHGAQGGLVADAVHTFTGLPAGIEIAYVALDKGAASVGQEGLDIGPLTGCQVIEDGYVGDALILQESFHQVGANKARTAGYKNLQRVCIR